MNITPILVFVLGANFDNIAVGTAYGFKGINLSFKMNLLIAFITSIGTLLSMSIGLVIYNLLPYNFTNIFGGVLIVILGLYFLKDFFKETLNKNTEGELTEILNTPEKADIDHSGDIDFKEALTLGTALTLNNFGMGIGASIAGMNIFLTSLLTFIFSVISFRIGCTIGSKFNDSFIHNYGNLISSLILISLGIIEILF